MVMTGKEFGAFLKRRSMSKSEAGRFFDVDRSTITRWTKADVVPNYVRLAAMGLAYADIEKIIRDNGLPNILDPHRID